MKVSSLNSGIKKLTLVVTAAAMLIMLGVIPGRSIQSGDSPRLSSLVPVAPSSTVLLDRDSSIPARNALEAAAQAEHRVVFAAVFNQAAAILAAALLLLPFGMSTFRVLRWNRSA